MKNYTIYASKATEVVKRLDRLVKKAAAYGGRLTYTIGEEHPEMVSICAINPAPPYNIERVRTAMVMAIDVIVDGDGLVKRDGWRVVAMIEHGDAGNIVTPFACDDVPAEWYMLTARCEHCGTNRRRAVTFMCVNDAGDVRQVGKSCLKDYTGIDPETAILSARVHDILEDDFTITERDFSAIRSTCVYDTRDVIALACDEIKERGYRRADEAKSTKSAVIDALGHDPSADGLKKADSIIAWLAENDGTDNLLTNCATLVRSGWMIERHVGIIAYLPIAYDRDMERKARQEARQAEQEKLRGSEYVAEPGARVTVGVAGSKLVTSWETEYGTTFLYQFVDSCGNVYVWKASGCHNEILSAEQVRGTVKGHRDYNGVKQTVLSRCKAV